jgi:uncharacterized membrane protein YphA (DoxX/SURF4 family)
MNLENCRKYESLILRVFLGLTLIFWGYEKLTVAKLEGSYQMDYASLLIFNVKTFLVAAGWIQIVLGLSMIVGFFTRISAGLLALMAMVTIVIPGIFIIKDVPHFAYAFATAGGAIVLFIKGGGAFSLDEKRGG